MENKPTYQIVQNFRQWLKGDARAKDQQALEKIANEDAFLADAMEGFREFPEGQHEEKLAAIREKLHQRTQRKRGIFYLRIAAAVAMLIIAGGIFWTVNKNENLTGTKMAYEPAIENKEEVAEKTDISTKKELLTEDTPLVEKKIKTPKEIQTSIPVHPAKSTSKDRVVANKKMSVDKNKEFSVADGIRPIEPPIFSPKDEEILEDDDVVEIENAEAVSAVEVTVPGFSMDELDAELQTDSISITIPEEQKYIVGTIRTKNEEPLIGVTIVVSGTELGTVTDFDGQFKLEWAENIDALEFSYTGYENTVKTISGPGELDITLNESDITLSEVTVTALGINKRKNASKGTTFTASPPYKKFDRYFRRNKVLPLDQNGEKIKGQVYLRFIVQANGEVSSIEVLQSAHKALEAEAIRLLNTGPNWKNEAGMAQVRAYVLVFE